MQPLFTPTRFVNMSNNINVSTSGYRFYINTRKYTICNYWWIRKPLQRVSCKSCLLVDTTSRCGTTSNQRWKSVMYCNVGINNIEQRRINVVYFNVDMNNVRQCWNNVAIFNVEFYNVGKRRKTLWKWPFPKRTKTDILNWI